MTNQGLRRLKLSATWFGVLVTVVGIVVSIIGGGGWLGNGLALFGVAVTCVGQLASDRLDRRQARGRHAVSGMANLVFRMLDQGMSDADVCNELGMEPEELLRLKHITGFSKLFADRQYRRAWVARSQVEERRRYQQEQGAARP